MKATLFAALCIAVCMSGCAYFRWQSDRPWNEPLPDNTRSSYSAGDRQSMSNPDAQSPAPRNK